MANGALITVEDGSRGYRTVMNVYVPQDCQPENFVKFVSFLTPKNVVDDWTASLVTYLRQGGIQATFAQHYRRDEYLANAQHFYLVTLPNKVAYYVVKNGFPEKASYIGNIQHLPTTQFTNLDNKIVRFYYNGGSLVGNRIVRVNKVENGVLKGVDLLADDDDNFRYYSTSKIKGELKVLA